MPATYSNNIWNEFGNHIMHSSLILVMMQVLPLLLAQVLATDFCDC